MNAKEALEYMINEDEMVKTESMIGDFGAGKTMVWFNCPGEYPCCHYDMTHEEFLNDYKNDVFTKI